VSYSEDRQFREALYLLLEKVRATKAAFYLLEPGGGFRLAAQYGFTRGDRLSETFKRGDPLPTTIFEHREPRMINDIRQAGRLAALMESSSSARLMSAPLYVAGRIVGFLDIRDKAGREPFVVDDVVWVKEVLRLLAIRVRSLPEFAGGDDGEAEKEKLDETASGRRAAADPGVLTGEPLPALALETEEGTFLPSSTDRVLQVVRERLRTDARKSPAAPAAPSAREVAHYRLTLDAMLRLPDVEAAAVSRYAPGAVTVWYAAERPVQADVEQALRENADKVFGRTSTRFPVPAMRTNQPVAAPPAGAAPLSRGEIGAIQSSVLSSSPEEVSILSLLFRGAGEAEQREKLRSVHLLVKSSLAEIRASEAYREAFRGMVNRFLEPGLRRYSALKAHSFSVGRLARKFAGFLSLSASETEQLTVAAILHDVGMRELNYEELSTKRNLDVSDVKLIREHPAAGAFLVEEVAWPYPVAPLIRQHHERWDGAGYPDGLAGSQIAFGARVIHICEAFDAMTSQTSYRQVLLVPQALEIITSKAGTQFDPELAPAFRSMIGSLRA
jgi:hypothetical protein